MIRFSHVILLIWLGLTLVTIESAPAPRAWLDWPPDYCRRVNCYCEPIRLDRLVTQPIASYSNIGMMLAAVIVVWAAFRLPASGNNLMSTMRIYPLAYGASLAATGIFSFLYHASLTRVGDYLDLMGMYLFSGFIALYNLSRLHPMRGFFFALAYLALNAILAVGLVVAYDLQQVYFAGLAMTVLVSEVWIQGRRRPRTRWPLWLAALLCFGLGAVLWILDGRGLLACAPAAPVTWHALWHLSVAGTALLLFFYYRSEVTLPDHPG